MAKTPKFRGIENPQYAQAIRELRRSNAAGTHDNRPKRERARSASLRAEVRRQTETRA